MRFPDLGAVLDPLPWAVIGAAATRLYMPERATDDLDVLIAAGDAPEASRRLREAGAARISDLAVGRSSWVLADGFHVDVLESREPWCSRALAEAHGNRDLAGLPVMPLPYLVLMKFRASRVQDIADVTRMLGQASDPQIMETRSVFDEWEAAGREDLESLIALGRLELGEP